MTTGPIRQTLQAATRDLHEALDALVGEFTDLDSYRRYLIGTATFRHMIEPALNTPRQTAQPHPTPDAPPQNIPSSDWHIVPLSDQLAQDLTDLGLPARPAARTAPPLFTSASARAGALYVLEGSALGARVLSRRAAALGLNEAHGARHLALQTSENRRWRAFLDWLESGDHDPACAIAAARAAFALATAAFTPTPDMVLLPQAIPNTPPQPTTSGATPAPTRQIA